MVNVVVVDRCGYACLRHYLEVYVNQHTGVETLSLGAGTVVVLMAKLDFGSIRGGSDAGNMFQPVFLEWSYAVGRREGSGFTSFVYTSSNRQKVEGNATVLTPSEK